MNGADQRPFRSGRGNRRRVLAVAARTTCTPHPPPPGHRDGTKAESSFLSLDVSLDMLPSDGHRRIGVELRGAPVEGSLLLVAQGNRCGFRGDTVPDRL